MALVPPIYGVISVTGTANEVEVTGTSRNVVVGLPDNVTINNLTVVSTLTGNEINATHFTGPLVGRVTAPCKNLSGTTLDIGTPVYISGYVGGGNSGIVEVKMALAASANAMPAVGLLESTLAAGDQGHVVINGILPQIDTTAFTAGQVLYVAPAGGLTATKPSGPYDLIQNIGKAANIHANQGQIFVASIMRTNDVPNILCARSWLQMPNGQTASSIVTTFNGASGAVTYSPPLASASITGVASFGNEFVVSTTGNVSLTGNYVKSFNGATGNITHDDGYRRSTSSVIWDDHYSLSYAWATQNNSGGSILQSGSVTTENNVGVIGLYTGTNTTGRAGLSTHTDGIDFGNNSWIFETRIGLDKTSDATDTFTTRFGFMDSVAGEPVDGAYFRYTHATNSGRWEAVTRSNSVETATDTGITATALVSGKTFQKFRVEVNSAGTSVVFKINGNTVATNVTNIPTGLTRLFGLGYSMIKSAGTNTRPLFVDYTFAEVTLGTAR
jgi:hypothetical protein